MRQGFLTFFAIPVDLQLMARDFKVRNRLFEVMGYLVERTGLDGDLGVAHKAHGIVLVSSLLKFIKSIVLCGEYVFYYDAGLFKSQEVSVHRGEGIHLFC